MHELANGQVPDIKLDATAKLVQAAMTMDQKRGMFEKPGRTMTAIVSFEAVEYTGHAHEDRTPVVKLRIVNCTAAHTDEEVKALLDAARAMHRQRTIAGTLDEVGPGPRDPEEILQTALIDYPTEGDLEEHKRRQEHERVRRGREKSGTGGRP
jgi:hypothetical protein